MFYLMKLLFVGLTPGIGIGYIALYLVAPLADAGWSKGLITAIGCLICLLGSFLYFKAVRDVLKDGRD